MSYTEVRKQRHLPNITLIIDKHQQHLDMDRRPDIQTIPFNGPALTVGVDSYCAQPTAHEHKQILAFTKSN